MLRVVLIVALVTFANAFVFTPSSVSSKTALFEKGQLLTSIINK